MTLPINQIICGDCLEVMKGWPDNCVNLIVSDPPYGSGGRDGAVHLSNSGFEGNRVSTDTLIWFTRMYAHQFNRITNPKSHCYMFSDWRKHLIVKIAFESVGWECRSLIVWNKKNGMGEYWRSCHEFILFFTKSSPRKLQHGSCFNVLNHKPIRGKNKMHPVEKPVSLLLDLISASTEPKELVFDAFCGSASLPEAAKLLGRNYIGIDISSDYVKIARQRLESIETGVPVKEQRQGQMGLFEK